MMSRCNVIGELVACLSWMVFMWILLGFGTAIIPYQPSMESEATFAQAGQP